MLFKVISGSFIAFLCFISVFSAQKPCEKHDFKVNYLRNCRGKGAQNFQIQNFTLTLTDDCHVVPRGCFAVKKKISDAKVNYFVSKPPLLNKNGTEDLCKGLADPKFQKIIAQYKIDAKCPIEAGQYCISKGSTLISQLNPSILNMAVGTLRATVNFDSEKSKSNSCIEVEAVISKKKH